MKHDFQSTERRRYPGAQPFSDCPEDRQVFFGRDLDIDRLFDRVVGTRLLVLFGKSGLGKTSLLMAGVFPRLRDEKPFLPTAIRLNEPGSPTELVIAGVTDACNRAGAELTTGDTRGIWEFLRTSLIWKNDLLLTPLLVFDQFEEIFTRCDPDFRYELATEIGALASGVPPERLTGSEGRAAQPGARLGALPPEVKLLISLREEYLGTLQELSDVIPGLFLERIRLAPLGVEEAILAICRPAACQEKPGDVPFATPPFEYETDALGAMLKFLRGRSKVIEPFQLQLLCSHAEEIVENRVREAGGSSGVPQSNEATTGADASEPRHGSSRVKISPEDLGGSDGMAAVLRQFYMRVIGKLGWRNRRRARRLCEEGLLSETGKRRMLDQSQIESDYGLKEAALVTLVDERLLRREQSLESMFYEISHDRLAESIEQSRPFRVPKRLRQTLKGAFAVLLLAIVALFWWNRKVEHARVEANLARADAEDLVAFMIGESFLEELRPVGRNSILEQVQSKVETYLDSARDQGEPGLLRNRGLALRNAGDILYSKGLIDESIRKYRQSVDVFEQLATPTNLAANAEQARGFSRIGTALLDQGKITESLEAYRNALALRKANCDSGDHSNDSVIDLADSHSSVGGVLNSMGRPRQALIHLDQSRDLLRPLADSERRSARLLEVMHSAIDNRASSLWATGDVAGEQEAYDQALEISGEFVQLHPFSADARIKRIIAVSRVANRELARGAVEDALELYEQIHQNVDELVRWDETNSYWRRELAATTILLAQGQAAAGRYEEALSAYDTAGELFNGLAKIDESNNSRKIDLSWLYSSLGEVAVAREEWSKAIENFELSERYISEVAAVDDAFADWRRSWYWVLFWLARAQGGDGFHGEAVDLLRRGRDMILELMAAAPEMICLKEDLAVFLNWEASELEKGGRSEEAEALRRDKEQAVMVALANQPTNTGLLNLAFDEYLRAGNTAKDSGSIDEAVATYRKALALMLRAVELEPDNAFWWNNIRRMNVLIGNAFYDSKRWAEAEEAYHAGLEPGKKAFAIASHEAAMANSIFHLHFAIAECLEGMGKQNEAMSEFDLAREWVNKAIEVDKKEADYFANSRAASFRIAKIKNAFDDLEGAGQAIAESEKAGTEAFELADRAEKKAEFANDVYLLLTEWADWYGLRSEYEVALKSYNAAQRWIEKAIDASPADSVYVSNLATLYCRIGRANDKLGDPVRAESAFRRSIAFSLDAAEISSAQEDVSNQAGRQNDLYINYSWLADFLLNRNDASGALACYEQSLAALKRAVGLDPRNVSYRSSVLNVYSSTAQIKESMENDQGAELDFRAASEAGLKAVELANDLNTENLSEHIYRASHSLYSLGAFYHRVNSHVQAQNELDTALSLAERAAGLVPINQLYFWNISNICRLAGIVREEGIDGASGQTDYEAAVRAGRRAAELDPENGHNWQALYLAQWYLGATLEREGNRSDALTLFREALKNAETAGKLIPEDSEVIEEIANLKAWIAEREP